MSAAAPLALSERSRRATLGDTAAMSALINGYAAQGLMLPKSVPELCRFFREYRVATSSSGELLACGGLRIYTPDLAEIVGLAVAPASQGRGLGRVLVEELTEDARRLGIGRIFAMTFEADFFGRLGFHPVTRDSIPEKMAADCRSCARRVGCQEIAVARTLAPLPRSVAGWPRGSDARALRPLRVLTSYSHSV